MNSVSTILTLRFLVLSILIIFVVFTPIIYVFRADLNLPIISGLIIAIVTVAGLLLGVWKWLMNSLSKRKVHVNQDYLLELKSLFQVCDDTHINPFLQSDDIKKLRTDLEKYASFFRIKLYPTSLLQKIDGFLRARDDLCKKVEQLNKMGNEKLARQCDKYVLLHHLGFRVWGITLSQEQVSEYERIAKEIRKEHQNLIDETERIRNSLIKLKNSILKELDDFQRLNELRTETQ